MNQSVLESSFEAGISADRQQTPLKTKRPMLSEIAAV